MERHLVVGPQVILTFPLTVTLLVANQDYIGVTAVLPVDAVFFLGLVSFTQILELKNGRAPNNTDPEQNNG